MYRWLILDIDGSWTIELSPTYANVLFKGVVLIVRLAVRVCLRWIKSLRLFRGSSFH